MVLVRFTKLVSSHAILLILRMVLHDVHRITGGSKTAHKMRKHDFIGAVCLPWLFQQVSHNIISPTKICPCVTSDASKVFDNSSDMRIIEMVDRDEDCPE